MTLAQVQATVAWIVAMIGTWAGLMMAVALMLPVPTEKAEQALERTPARCFWSGMGMLIVLLVSLILLNLPLPLLKLTGFLLLLTVGGLLTLGAAGLSQLMGKRISEMSGTQPSFSTLARGTFIYSAALFFPLIGWLLFAPVSAVYALGAGAIAFRQARRTVSLPSNPVEGQGVL